MTKHRTNTTRGDATNIQQMSRMTTKQHGAAGIARRAHKMATLRSLDRNEVLLLFIFAKPHIRHVMVTQGERLV